jgi:GR25 family glycosyltransferase involved in LPS biosynthesis
MQGIPAYCISLDRRPDRWAAFKATAEVAGLPVQRFSAVDAKAFGEEIYRHPKLSLLTEHNLYRQTRRSHYEIDAPGAVGASLSHFGVWTALLSSGAPYCLVFEDDCTIPADFMKKLERVVASLPNTWDLVQFQRTEFTYGSNGCAPLEGKGPWQLCTSLMGAYAYMVSRTGAEKLLERAYPIELHVDAYMAFMCRMGHVQMIWHPLIDIPFPNKDSDITHGSQDILTLPTDMARYGIVALDTKSLIGLMSMAAIVGGLVSVAYLVRK